MPFAQAAQVEFGACLSYRQCLIEPAELTQYCGMFHSCADDHRMIGPEEDAYSL